MSKEKLEYLENRVNNYSLIERQPIKILFASDDTLKKLEENEELIFVSALITDGLSVLSLYLRIQPYK